MKKRLWLGCLMVVFCLGIGSQAQAHCEIPCGIYDDAMRVSMLKEHVVTIEKSMETIKALEKDQDTNMNQLVRWIMNKEDHANQFQEIVSQYFMTQRIAPDSEQYSQKVEVLHQMLVQAMRCKQSTDTGHVQSLRELIKEFEKLYFSHSHD
ncbi:MAG: superoxide dismutase [Ni] [Desulfovermiculus sp.]|nr:superoxide dismutase [Ni] [Desulfovermiculus sp.]